MENGGILLKAAGRLTSVVIMEVEPMNHIELFFLYTHFIQYDEQGKLRVNCMKDGRKAHN